MCRIVNHTMCKVIFYFTLHLCIVLSGNIPYTAELNCEGLLISYGVFPTFLREGRQSTCVLLPVTVCKTLICVYNCRIKPGTQMQFMCNAKECSFYISVATVLISLPESHTCGNTAWLVWASGQYKASLYAIATQTIQTEYGHQHTLIEKQKGLIQLMDIVTHWFKCSILFTFMI